MELRELLPERLRHLLSAEEDRPDESARLQRFGRVIAEMRDDAVRARQESGIEHLWMACEEAYIGIDDANRAEFAGMRWAKPMTASEPLISRVGARDNEGRSTAFVRLTARYVDAAAAKISEITQPVDDRPFKLDPTPVPDLVSAMEDETPVGADGLPIPVSQAEPQMREAKPGDEAEPGAQVPVRVKDLAQDQMDKAEQAAERASQRIYDWMVECKHPAQMRKLNFDAARLGCGVLKGPIPHKTSTKAVTRDDKGVLLQIVKKTKPVTKWIDPWNFFPAGDCGEDIHAGSYTVERDFLSPPQVRKLKQQGFMPEAVDKVLKEGPGKSYMENQNPAERFQTDRNKRFEIWHVYGEVDRRDFEAANPEQAKELGDADHVFAIVSLINDTVVRAVVNPLDTGRFPYRVMKWRRRAGHWTGVGVAEQVNLPQRVVNSGTRALLNNGGRSAGSIIALDRNAMEPADGNWTLTPDKLFFMKDGSIIDDVRKAFAAFQIPNMTPQLMVIIEYGFRLAEESSNIPLISQGLSGKETPDTFGATQLQNNNANQLLRDVAHGQADDVTNPLVDDFYEWLLLDPEVPNEEKGDFTVNTNAAAAMIEQAIQDITIQNMAPMVANPAFGLDPKRWARAFMKSKRLRPSEFEFTEAEAAEQAQNQGPPPQIAVAQIRAESAEKIAAQREQTLQTKIRVDTDRDTTHVMSQERRDASQHEARMAELALRERLALLEYANQRQIQLDEVKAELAKEVMGIRAQFEMAGMDGKGPQVVEPPTEPPGRAPDGRAYPE